jgi:hypothetical protein
MKEQPRKREPVWMPALFLRCGRVSLVYRGLQYAFGANRALHFQANLPGCCLALPAWGIHRQLLGGRHVAVSTGPVPSADALISSSSRFSFVWRSIAMPKVDCPRTGGRVANTSCDVNRVCNLFCHIATFVVTYLNRIAFAHAKHQR